MLISLKESEYQSYLQSRINEYRNEKIRENHKLGYLENVGDIILTDQNIELPDGCRRLPVDRCSFKYSHCSERDILWRLKYQLLQNVHSIVCIYLSLDKQGIDKDTAGKIYECAGQDFVKTIFLSGKEGESSEFIDFCDLFIEKLEGRYKVYAG